MNNMLKEIIDKIDEKILLCDGVIPYKPKEREIIETIFDGSSFIDFISKCNLSPLSLVAISILLNDEYDDIDEIYEILLDNAKEINLFYDLYFELKDDYQELNKKKFKTILRKKDVSVGLFNNGVILKIYEAYLAYIKLYKLSDKEFFSMIPDVISMEYDKEFLLECTRVFEKNININKQFKREAKKEYDIDYINSQIKRVRDYYNMIIAENNRRIRQSKKDKKRLSELKNLLLLTKDADEIIQIDKITSLLDNEIKYDVLKYIACKNKSYYLKLEEEYNRVKANSIQNYIRLFFENGINFRIYSKVEQGLLLKLKMEFVENVFDFLDKIGFIANNSVIDILLGTSTEIITNIDDYIKRGILTNKFIKNNINILLSSELTDKNPLYEVLITNINLFLSNGINVIGLDEDGLCIFLENTKKLESNIELMSEANINIKTKSLRDYRFLMSDNLYDIISELKNEGIDINSNLYLLNLDEFTIKRIKICKNIGIGIYNDDGSIREETLSEKLFFIPNSKLDEYLIGEKKELKF